MSKPASGSISTANQARNAMVVATSGNAALSLYPAKNLTDPERTRRWRTAWSDTTSDTARVVMDLGSDTSPGIFSLIDCNATSGRVRLYGADDSSLTTNVIYYDFDLYDAGDSGAHVFYPQADSVRFAIPALVSNYSNVAASSAFSTAWTLLTPAHPTVTTLQTLMRYFGSHGTKAGVLNPHAIVQSTNFTNTDGNSSGNWYWLEPDGSDDQYNPTNDKGGLGGVGTGTTSRIAWTQYHSANPVTATISGEGNKPYAFVSMPTNTSASSGIRRQSGFGWGARNLTTITGVRAHDDTSTYYSLNGWYRSDNNDTGIYYFKHATDPNLSFFRNYYDTTDSGGEYADFIVPESQFIDGNWHVITTNVVMGSFARLWIDGVEHATPVAVGDSSTVVAGSIQHTLGHGDANGDATGHAGKMDYAYLNALSNGLDFADNAYAPAVAAMNAEAMYFLGLSTDDLKRRYWAIDFDGVTKLGTTSHLEVGALWLGDRRDIEVRAGTSVNLADPSRMAQSYGGSVYLDRQTPFRTASVSVEQLTLANAYALQSELATAGGREVVLDLHSSSSDATLRDSGAMYGRAGASPASATLSSGSGSTVALQITESRK